MRIPFATVLVLASSLALAADPQLSRLEPQGGQRGTELTVDFVGGRIGQDPQEVMLLDAGLSIGNIESVDDNRTRVTLTIPDECPLGRHALRLRTATGVSNLRTFHVGTLPEVKEQEPNSAFDTPQSIEIGCVVNGVAEREDVDYYAVELNEGDRLAVEIEGLRLGRTFFDPAIRVLNSERFELAASDDEPATFQDGFCHVTAPEAGRYIIEVRETAYRGDGNCIYRLHVGRFPRPAAVFPPGGKAGEKIAVTWLGDGRDAWQQEIQLPSEPTNMLPAFAEDSGGVAPSPNYLRVIANPVTTEVEPNDNRNQATFATAPGALVGVLEKPGDQDFFKFAAKKGQRLLVRSHSRELRSPVDTVIRILKPDGGRIAGNDDNQGQPDSLSEFNVPEDGEYLIQVEDHLGNGGETFTYWIEIAPEEPRVELALAEHQRYIATMIEVPAGNRMASMMDVRRRALGGDLQIDWKDLPPGLSVECPIVPNGEGRIPVLFSAAADASPAGNYVGLQATKTEGSAPVATYFSQRTWFVRGQNNRPVWSHFARQPTVVATNPVPYKIKLIEPQAPIVQRGVKRLKVVAERDEGFTDSILVKMLYNPSGISSNASLRIKQNENEVLIPLTANGNAAIRSWPIVMVGEANVNGRVVTATQMAQLTVSEPYLKMNLPRVTVEQGNTVEFPITIEQVKKFEGTASVKLENLPPGVTTEPIEIDSTTEKIVFPLNVATDARPGQHKGQFCRVVLTDSGEPVEHMVGYGELRVDKPIEQPKPEATAQASR